MEFKTKRELLAKLEGYTLASEKEYLMELINEIDLELENALNKNDDYKVNEFMNQLLLVEDRFDILEHNHSYNYIAV